MPRLLIKPWQTQVFLGQNHLPYNWNYRMTSLEESSFEIHFYMYNAPWPSSWVSACHPEDVGLSPASGNCISCNSQIIPKYIYFLQVFFPLVVLSVEVQYAEASRRGFQSQFKPYTFQCVDP